VDFDLDFSLIGDLDVESALRLVVDSLANCGERVGFPLLELHEAPRRASNTSALSVRSRDY
jgi:hypothetical protein